MTGIAESMRDRAEGANAKNRAVRPARSYARFAFGIVSALAGLTILVAPGAATGSHAGAVCAQWTGDYSQQSEIFLPWQWINWSYWYSDKDYIGRRRDLDYNITYQQWVAGGARHQTTTADGGIRYRNTSQQRAGYTTALASFSEWAHYQEQCNGGPGA